MNKIAAILDACPLLSGLPIEAMEQLAQGAQLRRFGAGDMIYPPASLQERLSIIAEGQVRICSSNIAGREATLAILDTGAWFGDTVFCPGTPRVFGASAHSNCTVVDIQGEQLRDLMRRHPEAYPVALEQVSLRLWAVMSIIQDDVLRGTEARVARRLFFMAQMHHGKAVSGSVSFRLTKELLANTMGMTRQGVHRVLKNIESKGLIESSYGRISVPSLSRLGAYIEELD